MAGRAGGHPISLGSYSGGTDVVVVVVVGANDGTTDDPIPFAHRRRDYEANPSEGHHLMRAGDEARDSKAKDVAVGDDEDVFRNI